MDNILGKRIESERIRLGLNQIELAKKLNLSSSASISQYESGDRIPSDDIKLKMCEIFNCSLDYLMGKSDIRNTEKADLDKLQIGLSTKDYSNISDEQLKQIEDFAKFVLKDNKKDTKEEENKKTKKEGK